LYNYEASHGNMQQGLYPISAVSNLTGVNSVTLRAWERRYGLIQPNRTDAGHRLYSEDDIERIKLILQLLDEGIAISKVKDALRIAVERETHPMHDTEGPWLAYQQAMLEGVGQFNENLLEEIYNEAMSLYPVDVVTQRLLLPLLEQLGDRWQYGALGVAEEHFFSVYIRNKLGARFHHRNTRNTGPQVVAACLPGEQHEFGLLLFAYAAHARGYRIILLGADMPLAPLAEVVKRTASQGIVLSGSIDVDVDAIQHDIQRLRHDSQVPVFVGGTFASRHRKIIEQSGAIPIGDDLVVGIHAMHKHLPSS
jgi:DNA-binding transcriptional MerR regulator